jgi:hypothetical protein
MKVLALVLFILVCVFSILVFFQGLERYQAMRSGEYRIEVTGPDYSSGHGYYMRRGK